MSELRQPSFIFLLKNQGKKKSNKVEVFNANLWDDGYKLRNSMGIKTDRYRLRVNGKWLKHKETGKKYFRRTEIRDMLWRSIYF